MATQQSSTAASTSSSAAAAAFPAFGIAPPQSFFRDTIYADAARDGRPVAWDIRAPQPALLQLARQQPGLFHGNVLDCGCGTGDNAIGLATTQTNVTAMLSFDFAELAVKETRARVAAAAAAAASSSSSSSGLDKLKIIQADVFALANSAEFRSFVGGDGSGSGVFDVVLDSAVFHCIGDDDAQARYLAAITPLVKRGGRAVMLVFSDKNADPWRGPRRISTEHATKMWTAAGWTVDSVTDTTYVSNSVPNGAAILMLATKMNK